MSRELDLHLPNRLYSAWTPADGSPRAIRRALLPDERERLEGRAIALEQALRPYAEEESRAVKAEIAAMLSGFRAMRQQGEDAAAVVDITARVLSEFPAWAIARTCLLITRNAPVIDGKPLDRRYTPNDTEIHAAVAGVVKLRRDALATITALLAAPVETPAPSRAQDGPEIPRPQRDAQPAPEVRGDGKHASRVMADLAARKARDEGPTSENAEGISDHG